MAIRARCGQLARRSRWRGTVTRAAGRAAGLAPRHCRSAANGGYMLRADERARGGDNGRARKRRRAGPAKLDAEGGVTPPCAPRPFPPPARGLRTGQRALRPRLHLVEGAAAIGRIADAPEVTRTVPAVLGCIEAAPRELLWAAAALEQTSAHQPRLGRSPPGAGRWRYRRLVGQRAVDVPRPGGRRVAGRKRPLTHLLHRGPRPWLHVVAAPLRGCSCGGFWLVRAWILHVACPVSTHRMARAIGSLLHERPAFAGLPASDVRCTAHGFESHSRRSLSHGADGHTPG